MAKRWLAIIIAICAPCVLPLGATARSTERVSVSAGVQANGHSGFYSYFGGGLGFSADARFVGFDSAASNLTAGDTNGATDAFVRDNLTGTIERVSLTSSGGQSNNTSYFCSMSDSAALVAYASYASNIVPGDTNSRQDIFVRNRVSGQVERVSVSSTGAQANDDSWGGGISSDGRYVVFYSYAGNLVTDDTNSTGDVFVRDRQTGETSRLSLSSSGAQGNGTSYAPVTSADGRFVAFYSDASNLVPGDTNAKTDIFVRDRQTNETTRVSVASNGAQSDGSCNGLVISRDGRYVVFGCTATTLVPSDTNKKHDVFVHDRVTSQTTRVSVSSTGQECNNDSWPVSVSADCRFVAFLSIASNLVTGDTNRQGDIFIHQRETGITTRVSVDSTGKQGNNASRQAALSGDGRYVAITSLASDLVPGDTNGYHDVFVHDRRALAEEKKLAEGSAASLSAYTITAAFPGFFYIEEADRSSGIRVQSNQAVVSGQRVRVDGVLGVVSSECSVTATNVRQVDILPVTPLAVSNADIGGGTFGLQEGVWGWQYETPSGKPAKAWKQVGGLSNIGILISTCGRVIALDSAVPVGWCTIDDGSQVGVKVILPGNTPSLVLGDFVSLSGVSSCESVGSEIHRVVRSRAASDIMLFR